MKLRDFDGALAVRRLSETFESRSATYVPDVMMPNVNLPMKISSLPSNKDCTKKSLSAVLASVALTPIGPNRGELTSRLALMRGSPTDDVNENAKSPLKIFAGATQTVVGKLSPVCIETFAKAVRRLATTFRRRSHRRSKCHH
jgi:hypothetical protein